MPVKTKIKDQKSKIKDTEKKTEKVVKKAVKVEKPVVKTVAKSTSGLSADLFTLTGRAAGKISLPKEIFGAKINDQLMAQAVRIYLANQRRGTVSTKTRGEVNKTTKKAWRQKGTGRARHGAKSAPIWVGGGVVFGPKPRDYSMDLNKKMKKASLFSAFSAKLKAGEIKVIDGLEKIEPKTKEVASLIKHLGHDKENKKILLIIPEAKNKFENLFKAARNIKDLNVATASLLNTYQVLNNQVIFLTKQAIEALEKAFLGKGENK
jgi:large subunit ribosomal protein L4